MLTSFCCRYRTLCFWLYAKPSVLRARLDERVDEMLEVILSHAFTVSSINSYLTQQGLADEIHALREIELSQTSTTTQADAVSSRSHEPMTDFTSGIYDTIGTEF